MHQISTQAALTSGLLAVTFGLEQQENLHFCQQNIIIPRGFHKLKLLGSPHFSRDVAKSQRPANSSPEKELTTG